MKKLFLILFAILPMFVSAYDWEHVSLSGGAEVVSDYYWRGQHTSGLTIQPYVEVSSYGFTLGAWGNVGAGPYNDFNQLIPELDLYLSYTSPDEHFTLGLTHYYYFEGPFFGGSYVLDNLSSSQSEISVSVFGHDYFPLEIGFNMMFGGGDCYSANGVLVMKNQNTAEKLMSMYIYLKYTFTVEDIEITPEIGLSPAPSMYTYYDEAAGKHVGFAMNNISCDFNYTFLETDYVAMYLTADVFFNLFDVGYEKFAYNKNCGVSVGLGVEL